MLRLSRLNIQPTINKSRFFSESAGDSHQQKVKFGPLDPKQLEEIQKASLKRSPKEPESWSDNVAVERISVNEIKPGLKQWKGQHQWFIDEENEYGNNGPRL